MSEAFTSAGAELVDLAFDATLVTDTDDPAEIDRLVEAQLMFSVGQLNGDSSVARVDRADYDTPTVTPVPTTPPTFVVRYHATLPVAWGGGVAPTSYELVLPIGVADADQAKFAAKYGGMCTDPEGGTVDAGDMFLFYRPRQAGCSIDPADIVLCEATVSISGENTTDKYPEYQRVWDDDELDVVAMFGRELPDGNAGDEGVHAYGAFVQDARDYLRALQPDASQRREEEDASAVEPSVRLTATLPDNRRIRIDVLSTSSSLRVDRVVDDWYDARSADADVILYSGHAGLGDNVRALMTKGIFRAGKYVVFVMNGCDTFAYVDDTLAQRRATLNPDDPGGTRYMDTVTNVLGAYFHSGDGTASDLVHAMIDAEQGHPKTYRQIFDAVDPTQIVVVDGEQDNEFDPTMLPAPTSQAATPPHQSAAVALPAITESGSMGGGGIGCGVIRGARPPVDGAPLIALAVLAGAGFRRGIAHRFASTARRCAAAPASSLGRQAVTDKHS